jgi:predicted aspartyl protease
MGSVRTPLVVTNDRDQARAEAGDISPDRIRSETLESVVVDTGASTLALPADVIARLGLPLRREVPIATATGKSTARLFRGAAISLLGREGTFDCLELPEGSEALLGVIPMETLGMEPDLQHQRLRLLPEEPGNTHFLLYAVSL